MKHKHHVIPRHIGGTNDPDNIVELTVEEHAEAHRLLYEEHGRWQDKLAWQALSGRIGKEEIIRDKSKFWLGKKHTEEYKQKMSQSCKGKIHSEETKEKIRKSHIGMKKPWITIHKEETKRKISLSRIGIEPWNKGKSNIYTEETTEKKRLGAKRGWEKRRKLSSSE